MTDQKIENLLNVSLSVNEEEREKSPSLRLGFDQAQKTWEIIVRFQGDIQQILQGYPDVVTRPLINNYAIIRTPEQWILPISNEPYIEYIEKPKRLFFQLTAGKAQSCINEVQQGRNNPFDLFGAGVIVAVIDTGIDATSAQFRKEDGSTRILNLWDQERGEEWNQERINLELENAPLGTQVSPQVRNRFIGRDLIGHGTDVAQIACGRDGVASEADIIVVKLGLAPKEGFPRTTQLMEALDYVIEKAVAYGKPMAVNISFGNNYGDHTGTSLLETYMNDISGLWKCAICVGAGNEGLGRTHAGGIVRENAESQVEFVVGEYETALNLQIWKNYWDAFQVEIIAPNGQNLGRISQYNVVNQINILSTTVLTYYGLPTPFSTRQEIYIDLLPREENGFILSGIWTLRFISGSIVQGRYDIWMPAIGAINESTGFLQPDSTMSITIPATSRNVISVGAYDARTGIPASFSGRGYVLQMGAYSTSKPELTAPGVDVVLGRGKQVSGTSYATPFVTGSAALLMEWGIVRGNDPYLYGEKLKAYLIKGAKPLQGQRQSVGEYGETIPDSSAGFGALCLRDSIPE